MVTAHRSGLAPAGTCDTHIHFYGPAERYPVAPTNVAPVPDAPVAAYREVMARVGIGRVVVVQPSAYAKDNRCTLDGVRALGACARAVVVVDDQISDEQLATMTRAGARGVRFHMLRGGVLPWDLLEPVAARVKNFGWHIQLQMDGRELPQYADRLFRLPVPLVIDHTGKFLEPVVPSHAGYRALLELLESGRVWVKLSAPYETSKEGPPDYMDVGRLARGLIAAAPERMLWATNWPHPSAHESPPDEIDLLGVIRRWTDDDARLQRILVENPATLYGFDEAGA